MPIADERSWKNRISISNTFRHFIWSNPAVVFVALQTLWCRRWKTWWTMKELQLTQWPQNADQASDSPAVKYPRLLSRYEARSSGRDSSIVTQMSTYFDAIHDSDNETRRLDQQARQILSNPQLWRWRCCRPLPPLHWVLVGRKVVEWYPTVHAEVTECCNHSCFHSATKIFLNQWWDIRGHMLRCLLTAHLHLFFLGGELGCISTAFYSLKSEEKCI